MRYLFAQPSPWSEELSRFCLVWMAMLGAAIALARGSHFAFEAFVERLAACPRGRKASWPEVGRAMVEAALPIMMIVVVLGGIRFGLFTPTEAAATAVAYAIGARRRLPLAYLASTLEFTR